MRVFAVALTLSAVLTAGAAFAQAPAPAPATQKPAAPAPAPATQKPAAPAPATQKPVASAPAPLTSVFGAGLKYAYVNLQQVAAESSEGKAAAEKIKAFNDQKVKEMNEKNRVLQAAQQKLEQGGSVLSDAARAQLQTEIDRQQRDIQRFGEDAQQDLQNFSQQVQEDFNKKLNPVVDRVAKEKGVHFVFSAADAGLIWADPSLNLTPDIIIAFNSGK